MSVGLILKTIPQTCMGCQFNPNYDLCVAAAREIEIDPYGKSRPDWCPLQEVEPVKYGHWIKSYEGGATRPRMNIIKCSICGWTWYNQQIGSAFCPGCGAKLDGGAE